MMKTQLSELLQITVVTKICLKKLTEKRSDTRNKENEKKTKKSDEKTKEIDKNTEILNQVRYH